MKQQNKFMKYLLGIYFSTYIGMFALDIILYILFEVPVTLSILNHSIFFMVISGVGAAIAGSLTLDPPEEKE